MTKTQLLIMGYLLKGYNIAAYRSAKFRLRDENNCPVLTMNTATFRAIKPLTRKTPAGLFVVDKNKVRQLHGNDQVKRRYKELKLDKYIAKLIDAHEPAGATALSAGKRLHDAHHNICRAASRIIKIYT